MNADFPLSLAAPFRLMKVDTIRRGKKSREREIKDRILKRKKGNRMGACVEGGASEQRA